MASKIAVKRAKRRTIHDLQSHGQPYVSVRELAEYWRVSNKSIYKQIEAGTLKAIRLGPRLFRISTTHARKFEQLAKLGPPARSQRRQVRRKA